MTAKEYLNQMYLGDKRIDAYIAKLKQLRETPDGISSSQQIDSEIADILSLRMQMYDVMETVRNIDEELVLRYRYLHHLTWAEIGVKLRVSKATVRRWHADALEHVVLPERPITLKL